MRATAFPNTPDVATLASAKRNDRTLEQPVVSRPVVCATDFSTEANAVVDVAAEFARQLGVPFALTHSVKLTRHVAQDAEATQWLVANRQRTLRAIAAPLGETGLDVVESVRPGRADETLLRTAAEENAQLIVVPSPAGRRAFGRRRLSIAARIAARARAPLLAVRDPESLRAWLREKRPLTIVVAYNFSATANAALRWVKQLIRLGPCKVVLAYANHPVEDYLRIGARGPLPFGENPPDVLAVLERDMKAMARAMLGDSPVHCRIESDNARTRHRLAEMARKERADLLILGSRQYTGLKRVLRGSVSRGLVNQAEVNIAVVPLGADAEHIERVPKKLHVLVATDFSPRANSAISHAIALLPAGGVLTLLHVAPASVADQSPRNFETAPTLSPAEIRSLSDRLRRLVPADAAKRGIVTRIEVIAARHVAQAISQTAERLGVDLICLGSGNRSEIARAFLGSVTGAVRSRTRRPLLLVPANRDPHALN